MEIVSAFLATCERGVRKRYGGKMALFKRMDIWSVYDGLDEIMDYLYNGNEKGSIYWDYYSEQLGELANIAGEMYEELQEIRYSGTVCGI